ncbi:MAG: hypothetical protein KGN79_06375 [Acidobacteriota bacterium]|nr:hypothetical protein [Acidobacteriota bacterium]
MRNWKVFVIPTLITLVIGGIYLAIVFHNRNTPPAAQQAMDQRMSADDLAVVRMEFPQHYDDLKNLVGKSVWMKDGYVIPAFPYTNGRVDFKKPAGMLAPLQKLNIQKVVKAVTPDSVDDAMSHGSRQVFYVVTEPGNSQQLAVPVGAMEGDQEQYFSDLLFFYDDPHTIYDNWSKDVWAAVDAHQVKPGMNELQTRLSVGQKVHSDTHVEGNRTVTYTTPTKKWAVTFADDKATKISEQ